MKILLMLCLLLAPFTAPAQEKQEKKTPEQIVQEARDIQNKFALEELENHVGYIHDTMKRYNAEIEERRNFYKKLDASLADGDPVLVEKSMSNINSSDYGVKLVTKSLKERAADVLGKIESAFKSDLIDEARYLEIRNMVRAGIAESQKPLSGEFVKLMEKAKVLVPEHFAFLEEINKRRP